MTVRVDALYELDSELNSGYCQLGVGVRFNIAFGAGFTPIPESSSGQALTFRHRGGRDDAPHFNKCEQYIILSLDVLPVTLVASVVGVAAQEEHTECAPEQGTNGVHDDPNYAVIGVLRVGIEV